VIVCRAEELAVEAVLGRREMIVAVADGEINAASLLTDWLVAGADARLDFTAAPTLGALVWRIGPAALRLYALGGGAADVADALVPSGTDSVQWTREWIGARSATALDSAAALIRRRGGDSLERAEFARLFGTGEPQEGLRRWLASRSTKRT
jgi:hypothetical protein